MATFTASERTGVKEMPSGVQVKTGAYTLSGTATASSVFLMCRIPEGAVIVDWVFFAESGGADNTWDLGVQYPEGSTSGSWTITQSALASAISDSASVIARPGAASVVGGLPPWHNSISSESPVRYAWVTAVTKVACSATAVLRLTVFYTMDEITS